MFKTHIIITILKKKLMLKLIQYGSPPLSDWRVENTMGDKQAFIILLAL